MWRLLACARHVDGTAMALVVEATAPAEVALTFVQATLTPCPAPSVLPVAYAHAPSTDDQIGAPLVVRFDDDPTLWGSFLPGPNGACGVEVWLGPGDADTPGWLGPGVAATVDGQPVWGTAFAALSLAIPPATREVRLRASLPDPADLPAFAEALRLVVSPP
jgi:hypothetical protein